MVNMDLVLAKNISQALKKSGKKQYELAEALNCSKQVVSNMLSGSRAVNAIELKTIAAFCHVSMESLVALPQQPPNNNTVRAFMGQIKTDEARNGISLADQLIDLYLYHSKIYKNGLYISSERSSL